MTSMTGLLGGSLPSLPLRTSVAAQGRDEQVRARARDNRRNWPRMISQQLFRGALARERMRADRFDQQFVLLLVTIGSEAAPAPSAWAPVIDTLASFSRETDILGWYEDEATLGVVMTELDMSQAAVNELERKIRRELDRRLGPAAMSRVAVELHVHSASRSATASFDLLTRTSQPRAVRTVVRDAMKRALDVVGSLALILLLLPTYLLIAVLVKLTSPGPVFYGQVRVGTSGRPFRMLKFRTMHVNADHAIHQQYVKQFISSNDPARSCAQDGVFKIVNDPRVTSIGRLLRKTSLDELPQFWNVLRGQMSLVGPRPPLPYEVEHYKPWHYRRVLEAKPGITGLWQVTGRSRTTFEDMVRLDLRYARTHSVWTDVKILLATPRAVFSGRGAC